MHVSDYRFLIQDDTGDTLIRNSVPYHMLVKDSFAQEWRVGGSIISGLRVVDCLHSWLPDWSSPSRPSVMLHVVAFNDEEHPIWIGPAQWRHTFMVWQINQYSVGAGWDFPLQCIIVAPLENRYHTITTQLQGIQLTTDKQGLFQSKVS